MSAEPFATTPIASPRRVLSAALLALALAWQASGAGCASAPREFDLELQFPPGTTSVHHNTSRTSIDGVWRPTEEVELHRIVLQGGVLGRDPLRWRDRFVSAGPDLDGVTIELEVTEALEVTELASRGGGDDLRPLLTALHVADLRRRLAEWSPRHLVLGEQWSGEELVEVPGVGDLAFSWRVAAIEEREAHLAVRAAGGSASVTGSIVYDIDGGYFVSSDFEVSMRVMDRDVIHRSVERVSRRASTAEERAGGDAEVAREGRDPMAAVPRLPEARVLGHDRDYVGDVVAVFTQRDGAWVATRTDLRRLDESGARVAWPAPCRVTGATLSASGEALYFECGHPDEWNRRRGYLVHTATGEAIATLDAGQPPDGSRSRPMALRDPVEGRYLLWLAEAGGELAAYRLGAAAPAERRALPLDGGEIGAFAVSEDGGSALVELDDSVALVSLEDRAARTLVEGPARLGAWLAGGRFVYFDRDALRLVVADTASGEASVRAPHAEASVDSTELSISVASAADEPRIALMSPRRPAALYRLDRGALRSEGAAQDAPGAVWFAPDATRAAVFGRFGVSAAWRPTSALADPDPHETRAFPTAHPDFVAAHLALPGGRRLSLDVGGRLIEWGPDGAPARQAVLGDPNGSVGDGPEDVGAADFALSPLGDRPRSRSPWGARGCTTPPRASPPRLPTRGGSRSRRPGAPAWS